MTTPELIAYIKNALASGQTKDAIKAPLLSAGWNESDVQEAFNVVNPPVTSSMPKSSMPASSAMSSMPPVSSAPAMAATMPKMSAPSSMPPSSMPTSQPIQPLSKPASVMPPASPPSMKPVQPASPPNTSSPAPKQYFTGMPAQTRTPQPQSSMPNGLPNQPIMQQSKSGFQPLPAQAPTINPTMKDFSTMPKQPMVDQKPKTGFFKIFIIFALIGAFLFAVWYFYSPQIKSLLGMSTDTTAQTQIPDTTNQAQQTTLPPSEQTTPTPTPSTDNTAPPVAAVGTTGSATPQDLISSSIIAGTEVMGKMTISGTLPIDYFYNGKIGVNVLDMNKVVLKYGAGTATVDSITPGQTSFTSTVDFTPLAKGSAYLELHNNNSSHLPENDKSVLIPITIK